MKASKHPLLDSNQRTAFKLCMIGSKPIALASWRRGYNKLGGGAVNPLSAH